MKRWLFGFCLLPSLGWAQTLQITEIAPHTLANQPEWFEFRVSGATTVDMTDWQISNGRNQPKLFADFTATLEPGEGVIKTETPLNFDLDQTGYFSFSPSPIGLTNDGGTIQILDTEGVILTEVIYPKAASRSTKNYEEREVLTWDDVSQTLVAQPVRAPQENDYTPSKGKANPALATPANTFKAVINEVSVDHDDFDFIEIFIVDGPDTINLQYSELKHNGTPLWYFKTPYLVSPGDYLTFKVGTPDQGKAGKNLFHSHARSGLSGGSGTVEWLNMGDTSQEKTMDALCWEKSGLSQTESKRVQKFMAEQLWQGPCVSIAKLVPNESIARTLSVSDINRAQDWFRHFNGSMGAENISQNQPPTAMITLQGTKKSVSEVPFQVNPTGKNSSDPDGAKDIKSYWWELNEVFLSDQANPAGFKIETPGEYQLRLTVTDQSGGTHISEQLVVGLNPISRNTNKGSAKARVAVAKALIAETFTSTTSSSSQTPSNFFRSFLERDDWMQYVLNPAPQNLYPPYQVTPEIKPPPLYEEPWQRQINLPIPVRQRARKNLGVLFSWRESPWPDLAVEWTAVVANDQKFGYFEVVYRGF